MYYNEGVHLNHSRSQAGTEVSAVRSGRVYAGEGAASWVTSVCLALDIISQLVSVNNSKQTSGLCTDFYSGLRRFLLTVHPNSWSNKKKLCLVKNPINLHQYICSGQKM